jgi:hypothetical protein
MLLTNSFALIFRPLFILLFRQLKRRAFVDKLAATANVYRYLSRKDAKAQKEQMPAAAPLVNRGGTHALAGGR